jgi:hypothetical protein
MIIKICMDENKKNKNIFELNTDSSAGTTMLSCSV